MLKPSLLEEAEKTNVWTALDEQQMYESISVLDGTDTEVKEVSAQCRIFDTQSFFLFVCFWQYST